MATSAVIVASHKFRQEACHTSFRAASRHQQQARSCPGARGKQGCWRWPQVHIRATDALAIIDVLAVVWRP